MDILRIIFTALPVLLAVGATICAVMAFKEARRARFYAIEARRYADELRRG